MFIHSSHFYSAPSSPLLLRGAPDYSTDTVSEFHAEALRQLQVRYLPKVPTWRLERHVGTLLYSNNKVTIFVVLPDTETITNRVPIIQPKRVPRLKKTLGAVFLLVPAPLHRCITVRFHYFSLTWELVICDKKAPHWKYWEKSRCVLPTQELLSIEYARNCYTIF